MEMLTSDFDYDLPQALIAQSPAEKRDESRLLILDRESRALQHETFAALPRYLHSGDLLVANRSKVIPARLIARKETGGTIEVLLLRSHSPESWRALARPSRRLRSGTRLSVSESPLVLHVESELGDGEWLVRFEGPADVAAELRRVGTMPLPPYIRNGNTPAERYQTVFGDRDGSVAAPTAGLHFSDELLCALGSSGINIEFVTLHIGLGTFRPVTVERVGDHHLHPEWGEVPEAVAEAINGTRARGGRVIAVGTTTTRLLETAGAGGTVRPFAGETDRFIYPGYRFQTIDGLITNFHLPRSSLLMLVSALAGRERILAAYAEAIRMGYRFYSFGDAMLII